MKRLVILLSLQLLLASLAVSVSGASNPLATVRGHVRDIRGDAVAGAVVRFRSVNGVFGRVARSDADGSYSIAALPADRYVVNVDADGFSSTTTEIDVNADVSPLDLRLEPGSIAEEVTVTATRSETSVADTAVALSIVGRDQLERRPMATIGDLFRTLPGTSTVGEGPFQVRPRIRGLDSNRVLVLVDGERLNNTRTSTSNSGIEVGLVDLGAIERVEVARGSGSVLYGTDALGGTINIITRDAPPRRDSGFSLGGGFDGYFSSNESGRRGSAYLTGSGERFAFRLSQTLDRFGNYHSGPVPLSGGGEDSSEETTEVVNSNYHGSNTQIVGRFFLDDSNSIRAAFERRRAADVGVPGTGGSFTAYFPHSNRDKLSLRYEGLNLTSHLTRASVSAYGQWQDRSFANVLSVPAAPPFFPGLFQASETDTDTSTFGFDAQTNWLLGRSNVLTTGLSYFRDRNRDSRLIKKLAPDFSTFPPSLVASESRSKSVPDATFSDLAFFAQDEWQATAWLRFVGGVRLDRFRVRSDSTVDFQLPPFFSSEVVDALGLAGLDSGLEVNDTAVSGDIGVVVKPVEAVSIVARVGRSFREPNLFERFFTDFGSVGGFVVGNPALAPESGINVDAGVKLHTRRIAGSFTYFNNTYSDFLSSRPALDRSGAPVGIPTGPGQAPIPVFQTTNAARVRIQGVEADFEWHIPAGASFLTPFGNVTATRGDDLERDLPLDFITPFKAFGGMRWQDGPERYWAEYSFRAVTGQDRLSPAYLATNRGAEPGFVTHDVRGGANLRFENWTMSFSAGVTNLGNRYFSEQFTLAPARGRSVTIGMNLRFH